jgi:pimeloyl-ACP methyl ester carboxylesterase
VHHGAATASWGAGIPLTVYPGCGHYPHLERPTRLAHDLTDFLCVP